MNVLRRLVLWTALCGISAAPSFFWASFDSPARFDQLAMFVGVVLFIAVYTTATSTPAYSRFSRLPFVRRTLYTGYGLRVTISILFPLGMAADLFPGMISIRIVERLGIYSKTFHGTLLTTIVQGTILNVLIGGFMLVVYAFQRMTMTPPVTAEQGYGFDVVLPPSVSPPSPVKAVTNC